MIHSFRRNTDSRLLYSTTTDGGGGPKGYTSENFTQTCLPGRCD